MTTENTDANAGLARPLSRVINVGIGEYRVARSPDRLRSVLGSCVGVLIYDQRLKLGGLAHVYLPFAHEFAGSPSLPPQGNRYSFADLLIPRMLQELEQGQGQRARFTVCITGGGYLLNPAYEEQLDIGQRNLAAVREVLGREKLAYRELVVRGRHGQTVTFNLFDGGIDLKVQRQ